MIRYLTIKPAINKLMIDFKKNNQFKDNALFGFR